MNREPMTRRYPYWRVTLAAFVATIIVCLLAGAGVANAKTAPTEPSLMNMDDGSGQGYRFCWITNGVVYCIPN